MAMMIVDTGYLKGDIGLLLLHHMAESHPERFDQDPVRMALARGAWAARN
jgi:hypothetical protein